MPLPAIFESHRERERKLQLAAQLRERPHRGAGGIDAIESGIGAEGRLQEVARLTGLTTEQIVAAHTRSPWRVGFGGFAPGFAYLIGGADADERLNVPRQSEPRTRVPAGSVALAGEFSAIYPRESPGGWQLIGHITDETAALWDIDRDPPALLRPGMWVQFRAVSEGAKS